MKRLVVTVVMAAVTATLSVVGVGLTTQPASAAVGCAVGVEPAQLLVTRDGNGNPTGRYAYGYAWADCTANEPIDMNICVRFQIFTGSSWQAYTGYNCNRSGSLHQGATITLPCSTVGGNTLIRTQGKVTIRGIKSGLSQTRSGVEVGTRPC